MSVQTGVQKLAAIQPGSPNLPVQITPMIPDAIMRKFPDLAPYWASYNDAWDRWRRNLPTSTVTIVNSPAVIPTPVPVPTPNPNPPPNPVPDVDVAYFGEYHIPMAMSPTGVTI